MGKHVQTSALSDFSKYPSFGVATGSANVYSVILSPAPTSYVNGFGLTVVIPADSTGTSTLNVNGLGAKTLKKANGNDVTNLKANGVYTFRYNSTTGNFILQGEGGSGNATAADIVAGKTASTDLGDIIGTATITSLGGKRWASGTTTSNASGQLVVSGLAFRPTIFIALSTSSNGVLVYNETWISGNSIRSQFPATANTSNSYMVTRDNPPTITSSGGTYQVEWANTSHTWLAFE